MSNNKFQKFIKKLFKIENEFSYAHITAGRPMNEKERAIWNSPDEVAKREQILQDGVAIFERI